MKSLNQEILKFEYDQNFKDQDFYVSKSNEFSFLLLNSWPKWEKNFVNLIIYHMNLLLLKNLE